MLNRVAGIPSRYVTSQLGQLSLAVAKSGMPTSFLGGETVTSAGWLVTLRDHAAGRLVASSNQNQRSLLFLLPDWLHGFPGLFIDRLLLSISVYYFLVFLFSTFCCRFRAVASRIVCRKSYMAYVSLCSGEGNCVALTALRCVWSVRWCSGREQYVGVGPSRCAPSRQRVHRCVSRRHRHQRHHRHHTRRPARHLIVSVLVQRHLLPSRRIRRHLRLLLQRREKRRLLLLLANRRRLRICRSRSLHGCSW